jgi:hypothetical protein
MGGSSAGQGPQQAHSTGMQPAGEMGVKRGCRAGHLLIGAWAARLRRSLLAGMSTAVAEAAISRLRLQLLIGLSAGVAEGACHRRQQVAGMSVRAVEGAHTLLWVQARGLLWEEAVGMSTCGAGAAHLPQQQLAGGSTGRVVSGASAAEVAAMLAGVGRLHAAIGRQAGTAALSSSVAAAGAHHPRPAAAAAVAAAVAVAAAAQAAAVAAVGGQSLLTAVTGAGGAAGGDELL